MKALMYHKVKNYDKKFKYENFISIENFKKNIIFLKKNYSIINCYDIFENNFQNKRKKIFLTFDDGLKCHYDFVYKILMQNKINAFFYICNLPLEKEKILAVHKIHLILGQYKSQCVLSILKRILENKMLNFSQKNNFSYKYFNDQNKQIEIKRVLNYLIKPEFRDYIIDKLFNYFFDNVSEKKISKLYYLNNKEIKEMAKNGMIIGSHTNTHPVLTNLSSKNWKKEISYSVDKFSYYNLNKAKTFCYPYGVKKTYNKEIKDYLNKLDVHFSVTAEQKNINNYHLTKNRQELPRFDCYNFFK